MDENEKLVKFEKAIRSLNENSGFLNRKRKFILMMNQGKILREIHDGKLYKPVYRTFSSFAENECGFTSQQARNLMTASEVYDMLYGNFSVLPDTIKMCTDLFNESRKSGVDVKELWKKKLNISFK